MELQQKVLQTIQKHHLFPPETTVLVAVSGGADSLALLHILNALHFNLHVATLDHGLRGLTGADDAEFVRQTAVAWGLPVTVGHADIDPTQPGIEARARTARYQFLAETAQQIGTDTIATAHHLDDQAETVLMHLIRGSGLHGLAGMRHRSTLPHGLQLIRPLLDVSRAEILAYCRAHSLNFRHDATNDETNSLRNRLRLHTIPHLQDLNPQITVGLSRLATIAAVEDDFMNAEMHQRTDQYTQHEAGRIALDLTIFRQLPAALRWRWLYHHTRQLVRTQPPAWEHIQAAESLMLSGSVGAVALLPDALQVRLGYRQIFIETQQASMLVDDFQLPVDSEIPLSIPGEFRTDEGWSLKVEWVEQALIPDDDSTLILSIPSDAKISLRTRRPGDRIAPLGMQGHTRKLKDWLIDRKIPKALRDRIPLLMINDQIAAIWFSDKWYLTEAFKFDYKNQTIGLKYVALTVAKI